MGLIIILKSKDMKPGDDYMNDFYCAVCNSLVAGSDAGYCDVCDWMQDTVQEHEPDYRGGANNITLNEARTRWALRDNRVYEPAQAV